MLEHPFLTEIPADGVDARRRIVQIVQRYKRCYDLCAKKTSRETCGIKNGHIRGKSETCSSVAIEAAADLPVVHSSKRVAPTPGKASHETPKRPAPPPPVPLDNAPQTPTYKTKRKSQSRRQQKQAQLQENPHRPVRHPSLSKKATHQQFYNSTYDVSYPNLSASTNDLAQLESFDEHSIITCIYQRFLANQIYTYIGDILVVSAKRLFCLLVSIERLGDQSISFVAHLWSRCHGSVSFKY